jgi:hypothetical protein
MIALPPAIGRGWPKSRECPSDSQIHRKPTCRTAHTSQWNCQALENPQLTGSLLYTLTSFTAFEVGKEQEFGGPRFGEPRPCSDAPN